MPHNEDILNHDHDCENCKNVSRHDNEEKWACLVCGKKFIPVEEVHSLMEVIENLLPKN